MYCRDPKNSNSVHKLYDRDIFGRQGDIPYFIVNDWNKGIDPAMKKHMFADLNGNIYHLVLSTEEHGYNLLQFRSLHQSSGSTYCRDPVMEAKYGIKFIYYPCPDVAVTDPKIRGTLCQDAEEYKAVKKQRHTVDSLGYPTLRYQAT